jgi:hypothetical protein
MEARTQVLFFPSGATVTALGAFGRLDGVYTKIAGMTN